MGKKPETKKLETTEEGREARELATELFKLWNETLKLVDEEKMAEFYLENCIFLPTLSDKFVTDKEGVKEYFKHFLEKKPVAEIVEDMAVYSKSGNELNHCGMYNFEVGSEDSRTIVEARFTYIWQKDERGDWKILHHHSSLLPKK